MLARMSERLDAFLSRAGHGTRSEVRRLVRAGRVRVDGVVVRSQSAKIAGEVTLDGEPVVPPPDSITAILYKPLGVSCSHDQAEAPLVTGCFPDEWQRAGVQWAGRLDRLTSGLLVCATDGQLLHRLIHPKRKVAKRYQVRYRGDLARDAVAQVAAGLALEGDPKPCRPARLTLTDAEVDGDRCATLELVEGRYHQVRRMIAALGGKVVGLHRDRIGQFDLPTDLLPGEHQLIDEAQVASLLQPSDDPLFAAATASANDAAND